MADSGEGKIGGENKLDCDVIFKVGPDGGAIELIRANKDKLAARSPVFFAMFNGELRETQGTIRVFDVAPNIFRGILQYIDCNRIELSPVTVLRQMYAAEKYMLSELTSRCEQWMGQNITDQNVFGFLECAQLYQRERLATKAREYILRNAATVLTAPGVIRLSQSQLKGVLSSDELCAKEDVIYEACLRWAKHQCSERGEQAIGSAIRQALGDCLHLIRFPLMKPSVFLDLMRRCPGVLTADEENSPLGSSFSNTPRKRQTHYVERFQSMAKDMRWHCADGKAEAIRFQCDTSIDIKGITIFRDARPAKVQIRILANYRTIYEQTEEQFQFYLTGTSGPVQFHFKKQLRISPGVEYTIVQWMWASRVCYGQNGRQRVISGNVTFEFFKSSLSENGTNIEGGQIPGILFSVI